MTLINQILNEPPAPSRQPGLPDALDDVLLRALAKQAVRSLAGRLGLRPRASSGRSAARPPPRSPSPLDDGLLSRVDLGPRLVPRRLGNHVYQGVHRALGIPVAIRVLRRDEHPDWEAVRARFLLEGRTLQVSHPGLLQVRDFGGDDRTVFVVTDLIDGPSLRQALTKEAPFPWPRVERLVRQALDAAAALHRRGGVIAGVAPAMIRLPHDGEEERIVMSSAGICSVQDVLATMREQELRGREASEQELPYVAPEVLMGRAPDPRADVFTIGVLAYQMAGGRLPAAPVAARAARADACRRRPSCWPRWRRPCPPRRPTPWRGRSAPAPMPASTRPAPLPRRWRRVDSAGVLHHGGPRRHVRASVRPTARAAPARRRGRRLRRSAVVAPRPRGTRRRLSARRHLRR